VLNHQTIEGLYALKLPAMAAGLAEQGGSAAHQALSLDERLGLLVDAELTERESRRLERYVKSAKLRTNAVVEDVDLPASGASSAPWSSPWPRRAGWRATTTSPSSAPPG